MFTAIVCLIVFIHCNLLCYFCFVVYCLLYYLWCYVCFRLRVMLCFGRLCEFLVWGGYFACLLFVWLMWLFAVLFCFRCCFTGAVSCNYCDGVLLGLVANAYVHWLDLFVA